MSKKIGYETELSMFLCLILRHDPGVIGITVDEHGWADVDELIAGIARSGKTIDRKLLEKIVAEDKKGRYSFSGDGRLIRANQGHSIPVDVELEQKCPPDVLYHGTAAEFIDSIRAQGIKRMSRLYVHFSTDRETAVKVGRRHGKPQVLTVDTGRMHGGGIPFYLSHNGIWLTEYVAPDYIRWEDTEPET